MNNKPNYAPLKCYTPYIELRRAIIQIAKRLLPAGDVIDSGVATPRWHPCIALMNSTRPMVIVASQGSEVDNSTSIRDVDVTEFIQALEARIEPSYEENGIKIIIHHDGRVTYGGQELSRGAIDFIVKNYKPQTRIETP
jgi:hypothetical protein